MSIRCLIVDDEPLARQRIRTMLENATDVQVIGECGDGRLAAQAIAEHRPDLVFLDIEMPELNGFGVIESVAADQLPAIIFVTAYNEHAVRAFEINALDYLLKPFDEDRFATAVDRARRRLSQPVDAADWEKRLLDTMRQFQPNAYTQRLLVKEDQRSYFVDVASIDWIEAAGKQVCIHAGDAVHRLRESLHALESKLDPQTFVRIHRSTIVNLDSVQSMEPLFHGEYRVIMRDATSLTLSRGYRAKLKDRFEF